MAIISKLPDGAKVLDLDAARVARAEARAAEGLGTPYIKLSAGFIEVHAEIPVSAAFMFQDGDIKGGLALCLVDQADVDVLWPTLSTDDIQAISDFITGKDLGESKA